MSYPVIIILALILSGATHTALHLRQRQNDKRRTAEATEAARISNLLLKVVTDDPGVAVFETAAATPGQPLDEVRYVRVHGGLVDHLGIPLEQWFETPFLSSIPEPHRAAVEAVMRGDEPSASYLTPWAGASGETRYLKVFILRNDKTGRVYGKTYDVTEIEAARRAALVHVDRLVGEAARADAEAARAEELRGLFDGAFDTLNLGTLRTAV